MVYGIVVDRLIFLQFGVFVVVDSFLSLCPNYARSSAVVLEKSWTFHQAHRKDLKFSKKKCNVRFITNKLFTISCRVPTVSQMPNQWGNRVEFTIYNRIVKIREMPRFSSLSDQSIYVVLFLLCIPSVFLIWFALILIRYDEKSSRVPNERPKSMRSHVGNRSTIWLADQFGRLDRIRRHIIRQNAARLSYNHDAQKKEMWFVPFRFPNATPPCPPHTHPKKRKKEEE